MKDDQGADDDHGDEVPASAEVGSDTAKRLWSLAMSGDYGDSLLASWPAKELGSHRTLWFIDPDPPRTVQRRATKPDTPIDGKDICLITPATAKYMRERGMLSTASNAPIDAGEGDTVDPKNVRN